MFISTALLQTWRLTAQFGKQLSSPTWLRDNFQVKLDLRPPGNHGVRVLVALGDLLDGQRVPVAFGGDGDSAAASDVLGVALPFDFSIGLLGHGFEDHGGALGRLLALGLFGEC